MTSITCVGNAKNGESPQQPAPSIDWLRLDLDCVADVAPRRPRLDVSTMGLHESHLHNYCRSSGMPPAADLDLDLDLG